MTDQPSTWGTGRNDAPPSITTPGEDPKTWQDSTSDEGAVVGAGGQDVTALTDDDAKTQVTLTGANPTITVALPQGRPVGDVHADQWRHRCCTVGVGAGGVDDGTTWSPVDRRTGEKWAGRRTPGPSASPRRRPTRSTGWYSRPRWNRRRHAVRDPAARDAEGCRGRGHTRPTSGWPRPSPARRRRSRSTGTTGNSGGGGLRPPPLLDVSPAEPAPERFRRKR